MCRRMTGKVLQSLSITFEEAEDGLQAIEKVQVSLGLHSPSPFPTGRYDEKSVPGWCGGKPFDLILVCRPRLAVLTLPANRPIYSKISPLYPLFLRCCLFSIRTIRTSILFSRHLHSYRHFFHLLFTDLFQCDNVMPNMCGPAAVKIIREMGELDS